MREPVLPAVRDPLELQEAHDALAAYLTGNFGAISRTDQLVYTIAKDVICWALNHNHRNRFTEQYTKVLLHLNQCGFRPSSPALEAEQARLYKERLCRLPASIMPRVVEGSISVVEAEQVTANASIGYLKEHPELFPSGGQCPACGDTHSPHLPHNASNQFYQLHFAANHGYQPTWEDAMAHCPEDLQGRLAAALERSQGHTQILESPLPDMAIREIRAILGGK